MLIILCIDVKAFWIGNFCTCMKDTLLCHCHYLKPGTASNFIILENHTLTFKCLTLDLKSNAIFTIVDWSSFDFIKTFYSQDKLIRN